METYSLFASLKTCGILFDNTTLTSEFSGSAVNAISSSLDAISKLLFKNRKLTLSARLVYTLDSQKVMMAESKILHFSAYHEDFYLIVSKPLLAQLAIEGFDLSMLPSQSMFSRHLIVFHSVVALLPRENSFNCLTITLSETVLETLSETPSEALPNEGQKQEILVLLGEGLMNRIQNRCGQNKSFIERGMASRIRVRTNLILKSECYSIEKLVNLRVNDTLVLEQPQFELQEPSRGREDTINVADQIITHIKERG